MWFHAISFKLALEYGIKFMETSAKANVNVESVGSKPPFARLVVNVYCTWVWCYVYLQAFLTLARDIKSKMDTKMVRRTVTILGYLQAHKLLLASLGENPFSETLIKTPPNWNQWHPVARFAGKKKSCLKTSVGTTLFIDCSRVNEDSIRTARWRKREFYFEPWQRSPMIFENIPGVDHLCCLRTGTQLRGAAKPWRFWSHGKRAASSTAASFEDRRGL